MIDFYNLRTKTGCNAKDVVEHQSQFLDQEEPNVTKNDVLPKERKEEFKEKMPQPVDLCDAETCIQVYYA